MQLECGAGSMTSSDEEQLRAFARISLGNLAHNMTVLQRAVGPAHPLWPAVKANAYGHGAVMVASHLVTLGYTTLCVAHVSEAVELLEAGVRAERIVVMAGMLPVEAPVAARWCSVVEPVCSSAVAIRAMAAAAGQHGGVLRVHLMVDTGMSRQGCLPEELPALVALCASLGDHLSIAGVMSHFACADAPDRFTTLNQVERFQCATACVPSEVPRHLCNSAGTLAYPEAHYDACRPGIAIYGLIPGPALVDNEYAQQLRPVLTLHARITCIKTIPPGVGVSYGHSFTTDRHTRLAVLPLGYGDGIIRAHTNVMTVHVHGQRCPQVGRVTMDQIVIDVTDAPGQVEVGSLVDVLLDGDIDSMANAVHTINYEITTLLSKRITRVASD